MPAPKKPEGTARSKEVNPDATTLNIPCLQKEKKAWKKKAGTTPLAAWAREKLNAAR